MTPAPNAAIDFVIKISKFCNLRCSYCYEYTELGERRRMQIEDLRAFFLNVRAGVRDYGRQRIHFVWHGGEPFLIPLDYYEQIGALQREILGDSVDYLNLVQTNLTVLTDRHIEFVREQRFFADSLGVSFDVYGDQRVDTRGRLRTDTVLANLQRLKDGGVAFGAITVLARNTVARIEEIYRFYDSLGISVRFLPFYKSATEGQVAEHALSFLEITTSLQKIFDAWLVSETATIVHPLEDYIRYALAVMAAGERRHHEPGSGEQVFLIDTDGAAYGVADTYDDDYRYGNVFREGFAEMLGSPGRQRAVAEARERMGRYCTSCPYFGYCPGRFAAEATQEQRRALESEGCQVRELIRHIVSRLEQTGLQERMRALPASSGQEALAVGA